MTQLASGSAYQTLLRSRPAPASTSIPGVELLSALPAGRVGNRWLGRECVAAEAVVIHRLARTPSQLHLESTIQRLSALKSAENRHLVRILEVGAEADGTTWLVTEFCGNQDGLLTLSDLIALKGGRLAESECRRAARHLLIGIDHAHNLGIADGSFTTDHVLIDRAGSLKLDLFGAARLAYTIGRPSKVAFRRDVAIVAELVHEALTGLPTSLSGKLRVEGLSRRVRRAWRKWFSAIESGAFKTPLEALAALPD